MAKSFLSTLLTIALRLLTKNSKTAGRAAPVAPSKAGVPSSSASTSASAVSAASNNFEKIKFGPFNWLVLERKGDTALVITEGIVERGPYHMEKYSTAEDSSFVGATWEKSDLRKYLNGKFLEKFSPADIARIVEVTNQNPDNPWFKTRASAISAPGAIVRDPKGGNPTKDKVFCLSIEEVCRYFGDSTARLRNKGFTQSGSGVAAQIRWDPGVKPSLSGAVQISDQNDKNRAAILPKDLTNNKKQDSVFWWWLRSPGEADILAATVNGQGSVKMSGDKIYAFKNHDFGGIRPALWLKM